MMKLAFNGGKAIRDKPFPKRSLYNKNKILEYIKNIIDKNNLSGYRGSWGQHFWGGEYVKALEKYFERWFDQGSTTKEKHYVLAVNSCTSALQIACGAISIQPFDEVIVTPWSMTCSATAPMIYGANPVFIDIEKDTFCIDPKQIEKKITKNTKAIIAVDLFGNPYDAQKINKIAKKYNLYVIEDAAQALGASYNNDLTGTLGDIGCFSFTQGKHITCGEGGLIVTKNKDLYNRCALIRNHAEAVINSVPSHLKKYYQDISNIYGFNMRMTEIQAAICIKQIQKIHTEISKRLNNVDELTRMIDIDGIDFAKVRKNSIHSYYVLPFLFDEKKIGLKRELFIDAVKAELTVSNTDMGVTTIEPALIWSGYIKPIYKMPLFNKNIKLPVVEDLQDNKFCMTSYHALPLEKKDIQDIVDAFYKVYENIEELK